MIDRQSTWMSRTPWSRCSHRADRRGWRRFSRGSDGDRPRTARGPDRVCRPPVASGAVLLGVFAEGGPGLTPSSTRRSKPSLAWLRGSRRTRTHRRRGVASSAVEGGDGHRPLARGHESMYVSATPTGSAVGFYLAPGRVAADPAHPVLYATSPTTSTSSAPWREGGAAGGDAGRRRGAFGGGCAPGGIALLFVEPRVGIEPTTYALRVRCSTD